MAVLTETIEAPTDMIINSKATIKVKVHNNAFLPRRFVVAFTIQEPLGNKGNSRTAPYVIIKDFTANADFNASKLGDWYFTAEVLLLPGGEVQDTKKIRIRVHKPGVGGV